jgi:hypothetical protein
VPEGQSLVSTADLVRLHDRLYRLEAALDDVRVDLDGSPSDADYRDAFTHLMDAATDLAGTVVEPVRA